MHISLLIFATMIWGAGFVGTRFTFEAYDPYWSHAWRFLIAAFFMAPFVYSKRSEVKIKPAILISGFLTAGLLLQTIGIKHTTLAKSGFITTFYALFTPLLLGLLYKRKFQKQYWLCVFVALIGMAFLCELEIKNINKGDLYILLSALFFSFHIIAIEKYSKDFHPLILNGFQIIFMGITGIIIAMIISGPSSPNAFLPFASEFNDKVFLGFIICSFFSAIVAFTIQVYVQKYIPSQIVGLIFLMEAIFASFFGYLFFNENLNSIQIIGMFMILSSIIYIQFINSHD